MLKHRLIAYDKRESLPDDCIDILVHIKNVNQHIVHNNTERYLYELYHNLRHAVPDWGEPSRIEWGGCDSEYLILELVWM